MNLSKLEQLDSDGLEQVLGALTTLTDHGLVDPVVRTKARAVAVRLQRRLGADLDSAYTWVEDRDLNVSLTPDVLTRSRLQLGKQYTFDTHTRTALVQMFGGLRPAPDCTLLQVETYPGTRRICSVVLRSNWPEGWPGKHLLTRFRIKDWTRFWKLRDACEAEAAERAELAAKKAAARLDTLRGKAFRADQIVAKGSQTLRQALIVVGISFKEYQSVRPKPTAKRPKESDKPKKPTSTKVESIVADLLA